MKITRETLQQIIKEEVAKEMNEEYSPQVEVALKKMMEIAQEMGLSQAVMDDLMAMKYRHGGAKPGGDFDKEAFRASGEMDSYDI
jgi:hypothetical protein